MMDHSEMGELLSAWADGELSPAQGEAVELHVAGCADCQRALAEFRLTRQHLALLADPFGATWHPDVAERVAARIRRQRSWAGWGRRLALNAASALAAGALVVALLWLLQHLPAMLPQEGGSAGDSGADGTKFAAQGRWFDAEPLTITDTEDVFGRIVASAGITDADVLRYFDLPTVTLPANTMIAIGYFEISDHLTSTAGSYGTRTHTYYLGDPRRLADLTLQTPAGRGTLAFFSLTVFRTFARDVVGNLGFELSLEDGARTGDVFIVLEGPDGRQTLLDPAGAPAISVPSGAQPGDRWRLFLWERGSGPSPVVEFILDCKASGKCFAVRPLKIDVAPSLKVALPPPSTLSSTKLVLSVPRRGVALHLISGAAKSPEELGSWGAGNTSRLVKDGYEDVPDEDIFVVLERSDGTQTLNDVPGAAIGLLKHYEGRLVGMVARMMTTSFGLFSPPRLMTEPESGERLRLFLWLRGGEHSPVVEFTLDYDADGNWLFVEPRELDVKPSLKIALPPPDAPSPFCLTLFVQDELASLDVCTISRPGSPSVPSAVQNLVFGRREVSANEVFTVLEGPDGTQIVLDSLLYPWIPVLPGVQPGERMRLFLWARDGDHSFVLEFVLDRDADGNWIATDLQKIAATPVLKVTLPPVDILPSTHIALESSDGQFRLHLFGSDLLAEDPINGAVRNLGYRLGGATGDAFVVVEVVGGEQMILSPDEAPSIRLPPGTRSGDRVRLFAATPDGVITPAVEFVLSLKAVGWWALDLDQADELPVFELHSP